MRGARSSLAHSLLNSIRPSTTAFRRATSARLQHSGPSMAVSPLTKFPMLLVLDFDGTLTRRDTMHLVAECGYAHQSASGRLPQPSPWSEVVDAYMTDFKKHAKSYLPEPTGRTSPEQELAWLDSLEQIEEASFQRALAAGIFDNLTHDEMERAGRLALYNSQLRLRSGWYNLAMSIRRHNATHSSLQLPIRVLSVNWSAAFIRGVLRQASEDCHMDDPLVHAHHIYANEIPSIVGNDLTPSAIGNLSSSGGAPLRTSGAKASILKQLRETIDDKESPLLIYVGDSTTDLACLLAADFGFCVYDDPMSSSQKELVETCRRIGVEVSPIAEAASRPKKEKTIWSVRDFFEVADWLDQATKD